MGKSRYISLVDHRVPSKSGEHSQDVKTCSDDFNLSLRAFFYSRNTHICLHRSKKQSERNMAELTDCVPPKVDDLTEEHILEIAIHNASEEGGAFE